MSFLGGIFSGSSPTETGDENAAGGVMGFGTAVGEGDVGTASSFDQDLLDGNPAQTAKLLAPQIADITGQGTQQKATLSQFGNRSGGNNSEAQTIDDTTRGNIQKMISNLTSGAAATLVRSARRSRGLGLQANQIQDEEAQQRLQDQQNSLFGNRDSEPQGGLLQAQV